MLPDIDVCNQNSNSLLKLEGDNILLLPEKVLFDKCLSIFNKFEYPNILNVRTKILEIQRWQLFLIRDFMQ